MTIFIWILSKKYMHEVPQYSSSLELGKTKEGVEKSKNIL